ncbi:hypothetical protein [Legionella maioricensis]|uniref:Uncharacterized protein n=1 Tax=Legionella maioricensis TaxID=2896528 RepID=A0A9X2D054_9GAMM|nr:hypothetical protein [Legionella maioricensis]MCL9683879.1 hypothetical protein [Legionella maioricensis]MCL9686726.1 hypothetical protein [Legionella maioricensis]
MAKPKVKNLRQKKESIRYSTPELTWRPNPTDPYIYVSFSNEQLAQIAPMDRDPMGVAEITPEMISEYKKMIEDEYISRGMPIRYLSGNESQEALMQKNVVYFSSMKYTVAELERIGGPLRFATRRLFATDEAGQERVAARIIRLPHFSPNDMTKRAHKRGVIHEMFHAFPDGKHHTAYVPSDIGPFSNGLDCEESIMPYDADCAAVMDVDHNAPSFNGDVHQYLEARDQAHPITLGPVDIAVIADFKKEWQDKNKIANNDYASSIPYPGMRDHDELMLINSGQMSRNASTQFPLTLPESMTTTTLMTPSAPNDLVSSLLNLGLFALASMGLYTYSKDPVQVKTSDSSMQHPDLEREVSARKIVLRKFNMSLETALEKLCGTNHSKIKDSEQAGLVKSMVIDVLNDDVTREIGLAFNRVTNIKNKEKRYERLVHLAQDWHEQQEQQRLGCY